MYILTEKLGASKSQATKISVPHCRIWAFTIFWGALIPAGGARALNSSRHLPQGARTFANKLSSRWE